MLDTPTLPDFEALNTLVADPDLERLNDLLSEFNLFEALGVVRQELRHSNFLAWLLNPQENHGLGDYALRKFVMLAAREINDPQIGITPAYVSNWKLATALVQREWRNVDVLISDPDKKYVILVENKIDTSEHSDQLNRYRQIVQQEYPNATAIYIFLTPEGTSPYDEASGYISLDYSEVHHFINELLNFKENTLSQGVLTFIRHYSTMLRRHIMPESDIAQLCREIYKNNKRALDLIFKHGSNLIYEHLLELVKQESTFELAKHNTLSISFDINEWNVPHLRKAKWQLSDCILVFNFGVGDKQVLLKLQVELKTENPLLQQHIIETVQKHKSIFQVSTPTNKNVILLYRKRWLRDADYESGFEEIQEKLNNNWQEFLEKDFPRINEVIMREIVNNPELSQGENHGTV